MIATNEESIRGVDFRAPSTGIVLVCGLTFSHARNYMQAMGRVGRFDEEGTRIGLKDIDRVDSVKHEFATKQVWAAAVALK